MPFIYSDLNGTNPTQAPLKLDVDAVFQSLRNLFNTRTGERPFLPEYGLDLEDELFQLIDDVTGFDLLNRIITAVERWEGRVSVDLAQSEVVANADANTFDLTMVFRISGLGNQAFEFRGSFTQ